MGTRRKGASGGTSGTHGRILAGWRRAALCGARAPGQGPTVIAMFPPVWYIVNVDLPSLLKRPGAPCSKRCVHLTNYSVNKKSNKFVAASGGGGGGGSGPGPGAANGGSPSAAAGGGGGGQGSAASLAAAAQAAVSRPGPPADPLAECGGSKWSLAGLRAHLEARGLGPGWEAVWRQVGTGARGGVGTGYMLRDGGWPYCVAEAMKCTGICGPG